MHQHDTPQQQQHLHHSHSEGVERLVRKKPKLESKVLNISAAADASRGKFAIYLLLLISVIRLHCTIHSHFLPKGPRDYMEDTHTVRDDLKFYGVYDGHGGEQAAKLLQNVSLYANMIVACFFDSLLVTSH